LDGKSILPVLFGKTDHHKDHVYALHTTRGIINGSDHFGIRSIRSKQYKYIRNLTPDVEFTNAETKSPRFDEWKEIAKEDKDAADKVHRYSFRPAEELYDVTKDWYEWKNLADDPKYADIKKDLSNRLDAWMKSQGDQGQATELAAFEHQKRGQNKKKNQGKKKGKK